MALGYPWRNRSSGRMKDIGGDSCFLGVEFNYFRHR